MCWTMYFFLLIITGVSLTIGYISLLVVLTRIIVACMYPDPIETDIM